MLSQRWWSYQGYLRRSSPSIDEKGRPQKHCFTKQKRQRAFNWDPGTEKEGRMLLIYIYLYLFISIFKSQNRVIKSKIIITYEIGILMLVKLLELRSNCQWCGNRHGIGKTNRNWWKEYSQRIIKSKQFSGTVSVSFSRLMLKLLSLWTLKY